MNKANAEDSYDYPNQAMQKTIIVEQPEIIIQLPAENYWAEGITAVAVALVGAASLYWQRHKHK